MATVIHGPPCGKVVTFFQVYAWYLFVNPLSYNDFK